MHLKRQLKIGDRVRAYRSGYSPKDGTVIENGPGTYLIVKVVVDKDDGETTKWQMHPQQLRRLKPKAALVTGERVEVGITPWAKQLIAKAERASVINIACNKAPDSPEFVRLVELKPSEIILSRQKLAEAFNNPNVQGTSSKLIMFSLIADQLGLGLTPQREESKEKL